MMNGYDFLFEMLELLGKKYVAPLLILLLINEEITFSKLKRDLKLTSRSLSKKLKLLEAGGFVEKIIIRSSKKAVYTLSEKGKGISKMMLDVAPKFKTAN